MDKQIKQRKQTSHGTFATAINCLDGRTQLPVYTWAQKQFGVDFVDMVTAPGPDKILSAGSGEVFELIKKRVKISIEKHGSKNIVIVAHHDCAGNPVEKSVHLAHLQKAADNVKKWGFGAAIKLLWVNEKWMAEEIA